MKYSPRNKVFLKSISKLCNVAKTVPRKHNEEQSVYTFKLGIIF